MKDNAEAKMLYERSVDSPVARGEGFRATQIEREKRRTGELCKTAFLVPGACVQEYQTRLWVKTWDRNLLVLAPVQVPQHY